MGYSLKIFDGIGTFSLQSLAASALSFGFMLSMMAILGFEEYGLLVLFFAISLVIEGVSSSQSWQGISRYFANGFDWKGSNNAFSALLLTDFVNICISILAISILITFFDDVLQIPNFGLLIFFLILPKLIAVPLGLIRVMNHFIFLGWNMILSQSLKILGLFLLFYFTENKFDVLDIIILYIITEWIFFLMNIGRIFKNPQFRLFVSNYVFTSRNKKLDVDVIKFQTICHGNCASVLSVRHFDEIIVGIYLSTELLGFWKLLKLSTGIIGKFIEPLYVFVFPKLEVLDIRTKDKEFVEASLDKCKRYLKLFSFIVIGLLSSILIIAQSIELPIDKFLAGIIIFWISAVNLIYFFSHPLAIRCRGEMKVLILNIVSGSLFLSLLFACTRMESLFVIAAILALYTSINHYGRVYITRSFIYGK